MVMADYATLEQLAADLCQLSGGNWQRKYTKRNVWRRRAQALIHLANGDKESAERAMRGEP